MSYGLKVWNASGVVTFDSTIRVARVHSTHAVNLAYGASVFVYIPGYTLDGTWSYYFTHNRLVRASDGHFGGRVGIVLTEQANGIQLYYGSGYNDGNLIGNLVAIRL